MIAKATAINRNTARANTFLPSFMGIAGRGIATDALLFTSGAQTNTAAINTDACLVEVFASAMVLFIRSAAVNRGCAKVFV